MDATVNSKFLTLLRLEPVFQPVASRYTDCAVPSSTYSNQMIQQSELKGNERNGMEEESTSKAGKGD
jgi:hypothetical protein